MFNKLLEKGKNFVNKQKENKKNEKKNDDIKEKQPNDIDNQEIKIQSNHSNLKTIEDKTNYLLKKTTYHSDKLMNLTNNLIKNTNNQNIDQKSMTLLQNSLISKQNSESSTQKLDNFQKENNINIENVNLSDEKFQQFLQNDLQLQIDKKQLQNKDQNPLFCVAVINFHHKLGSVVEYNYPQNIDTQILDQLTYLAMPDAIHNKEEDFIYFTVNYNDNQELEESKQNNQENQQKQQILYGVSYFKQIKVTDKMREVDKDLTRNQMQKCICVLSKYPLFGYLVSRLAPTTQAYFGQDNFLDFSILESAYNSINQKLIEASDLEETEFFIGTSPKTLLYQFKEKVMVMLKTLMLEGRIIVFSLNSQACSNFILSLLSLLPGMLYFNFQTLTISQIENELRDYGLPFRLFDQNQKQIEIYFTIQSLDNLKKNQSYLIGTTNQLIRGNDKCDLLIDIDKKSIQFKNSNLEKQTKLSNKEKRFMESLYKNLGSHLQPHEKVWTGLQQNIFSMDGEWEGSNDQFRYKFQQYYKEMLIELSLYMHNLQQVESDYKNMLTQNEKFFFGDNTEMQSIEDPNNNPQINANLDGESMMAMGMNSQETSKSKFIKKMREILLVNEKPLKKFNIKFISKWTETDNFKFWQKSKYEKLYQYSPSFQEKDQLQKDKFHVCEQGDIYFGQIIDRKKEGKGVFLEVSTGYVYQGQFLNDQKDGQFIVSSLDESYSFQGMYKNDLKQDYGELNQKQKFSYKGNFENDLFQGQGIYIDKNQNEYEGDFRQGQKWGMGKLKYKNGDMYIGDFENNQQNGKGQIVYTNGDLYAGEFKNGLKYGLGELQFDNNEQKYTGEFQEDKMEGTGSLLKNKNIYQGLFRDGSLVEGVEQLIKFENGDVWNGPVKNWQMHGQGIFSDKEKDQNIYCIYEEGQLVKQEENKEEQEKLQQFEKNLEVIEKNDPNEAIIEKDIYSVKDNEILDD